MDIRDTTYANKNVVAFDAIMQGLGICIIVAIGFAVINLLF